MHITFRGKAVQPCGFYQVLQTHKAVMTVDRFPAYKRVHSGRARIATMS